MRKKMRRASNLSQLAAEASFEREMKGASPLCCCMKRLHHPAGSAAPSGVPWTTLQRCMLRAAA